MSARLDRNYPAISTRDIIAPLSNIIAPSMLAVDPSILARLRTVFKVNVAQGRDLRSYDVMLGQQQVIEYLEHLNNQ